MKTKTLLLAMLFMCIGVATLSAQQKVAILGDSYSTFAGHLSPATNFTWYSADLNSDIAKNNDVHSVEQTWWHQFVTKMGYELVCNNSFSGSTICHTGYNKEDYTDRSFITRLHHLGNPDIILIFGGTNDSWAGVPIGEYQYEGWTNADLYNFRPAFAYMLHNLRQLYPQAKIYNITNSELSEAVTVSADEICRHYNVPNLLLKDVEKQWGHPSVRGMEVICNQLIDLVK
ncbi:MAG: hypothetical protein E7098_09060 [Mediterranea massiliensis]|nr:hypothetical protein [Mediterranea massiliensis]